MLTATLDHRRIAVRSGHGVGKTFVVACLVLWWLYARQGLVVTTAPTWEHVQDVLWREIKGLWSKALVKLPVRREPGLTELAIDGTWYAVGLSTNMPSAFQGRHHPRLLVVVDEAPGVNEQVHLEISTLATDPENRIVMIGNPTELSGTFYEAFTHPETWYPIHISCLEHPNVIAGKQIIKGAVSRYWVEERERKWGKGHPFWYSRVLGDFPKVGIKGVIPLGWIERQTDEEQRQKAIVQAGEQKYPKIGGLDVARYGDNRCVMTIRQGDAILEQYHWHHMSTMHTVGEAVKAFKEKGLSLLVVDSSGIGAAVADRLLELDLSIYAYNGGHSAFTKQSYANRRSEMWWHLRERFEHGRLWLPRLDQDPDNKLVSDLVAPTYELTSAGRIRVETKEKLLERGVKSPDFADSLVLCFAAEEDPAEAFEEKPNEAIQDPVPLLESKPENQLNWAQFPDDF